MRTIGCSLAELALAQEQIPPARGHAIQLRVNTEKLRKKDGLALPASGTLTAFEPPTGPGVRIDTAGHVGYRTNPRFDSLLAKVIVHAASPRFEDAVRRAERALREFRIEGIQTNLGLLEALLRHPAFAGQRITTRFVEEHAAELVAAAAELRHPHRVARYLEDTTATFNKWYDTRECRMLPKGDEPVAPVNEARLMLTVAARTVLANGLELLGVSAPERM